MNKNLAVQIVRT